MQIDKKLKDLTAMSTVVAGTWPFARAAVAAASDNLGPPGQQQVSLDEVLVQAARGE